MAESTPSPRSYFQPIAIAVLAFSVLVGFAFLPRIFPSSRPAIVGQQAPDFSLEILHNGERGDRIRLADLRGQPVLLDFWATWCKPCQMGAPVLERVYRRAREKGVVFVGINTSDPDGRELAARFAEAKKLTYPIVFDDGDAVAAKYGVTTLPTVVVIDREGKIVAFRVGLADEGQLEELLEQAL